MDCGMQTSSKVIALLEVEIHMLLQLRVRGWKLRSNIQYGYGTDDPPHPPVPFLLSPPHHMLIVISLLSLPPITITYLHESTATQG